MKGVLSSKAKLYKGLYENSILEPFESEKESNKETSETISYSESTILPSIRDLGEIEASEIYILNEEISEKESMQLYENILLLYMVAENDEGIKSTLFCKITSLSLYVPSPKSS